MRAIIRDLELIAPPPPAIDEVTEARARVAELFDQEQRHNEKAREFYAAERDLEQSAGPIDLSDFGYFESAATVQLAEQLMRFTAAQQLATKAAALAHTRRYEAIRAVGAAEAAALRAEAAATHVEADMHVARAAKLLAQLESHEACHFIPEADMLAQVTAYRDPRPVALPRSRLLADRVRQLEVQARQAESRPVVDHGAVDLQETKIDGVAQPVTADAVVQQLLTLGAFVVAPALPAVYAWVTTALAAAAEKRAAARREDLVIRLHLVWTNGQIDAQASRVTLVDV